MLCDRPEDKDEKEGFLGRRPRPRITKKQKNDARRNRSRHSNAIANYYLGAHKKDL